MPADIGENRVFLFLQGPHGPFFHRLGQMLRLAGAEVWRVGFNSGDRAFWLHSKSYIPFRGTHDEWIEEFGRLVAGKGVTDIVLSGDIRPIHADAVKQAREMGLTVHVFEEGYIRPYWVTYERGGSNGNSRLIDMTVAEIQEALARSDMEAPLPPGHALRDAPLGGPGGPAWLVEAVEGRFTLLAIGEITAPELPGVARLGIAQSHADYPCFSDPEGHVAQRYGTGRLYLLRPDGHVCASFPDPDPAAIRAAPARAKGACP